MVTMSGNPGSAGNGFLLFICIDQPSLGAMLRLNIWSIPRAKGKPGASKTGTLGAICGMDYMGYGAYVVVIPVDFVVGTLKGTCGMDYGSSVVGTLGTSMMRAFVAEESGYIHDSHHGNIWGRYSEVIRGRHSRADLGTYWCTSERNLYGYLWLAV